MPHIIETTAYKFEELSESSKETARDWYRQFVFQDSSDWDFVYEDAERMANLMGIEIEYRTAHGWKGKTWQEPCIFFSGFSSQGDGASFHGWYQYAKGAVKAIKDETGFGLKCSDGSVGKGDMELIRIAQALQDVQKRYFYKLRARMGSGSGSNFYSHSGTMSVDVSDYDDRDHRDSWSDTEEEITQLMRDFADWIYKQLSAEYDYQTSDESIDENILANEYDFDENGRRIG